MKAFKSLLESLRNNNWIEDSKCQSVDPEMFFAPTDEENTLLAQEATEAAKRVCNGTDDDPECPVKQECLRYAIENNEKFGVWGGLDEVERRRVRRDIRAAEREAAAREALVIRRRRVIRKEWRW